MKEEKKDTVTHSIMSVLFVCEREMNLCEEKEGKKENLVSLQFTIILILMNEDVFHRIVFVSLVFLFLVKVVLCLVVQRKIKNIFLEKIKIKNKTEKQKKCRETTNIFAPTQLRRENSTLIVKNGVPMVSFAHFTVLL